MKNKKIIITIIYSLFISLSLTISKLLKINNYIFNFKISKFIINYIFYFTISYIIINILIIIISKIKIKKDYFDNKKITIISFISIFITGLIFLIVHYPGVGFVDTFSIIEHPLGAAVQHPLVYNLYLEITFRLFLFIFKDVNLSYFLTSIVELAICTILITYMIYWFNKTIKNKFGTILLIIYFTFIPIITNYNVALIKDSIFGIILLLYIPLLYKMINTNDKILENKIDIYKLTLIFILTCLIRNNGLYIVILISLILIIKYKNKKIFKILLITLLTNIIINHIGNQEQLFQEKIGIPLQQIAYTLKYNENNINKKDKEYINKLMKIELMKEKYNCFNVDTLKWDDYFNREYLKETKFKFIKVWFNIIIDNPISAIRGYLLTTYDFWAIDTFKTNQSRFLSLKFSESYEKELLVGLDNKNILPNNINNNLKKIYEKTTISFNNATLFFILLLTIVYTYLNNKKLILLSIPLISVYLTLIISTPVSFPLRYLSAYLYTLPFLILIIITKCNEKQ